MCKAEYSSGIPQGNISSECLMYGKRNNEMFQANITLAPKIVVLNGTLATNWILDLLILSSPEVLQKTVAL